MLDRARAAERDGERPERAPGPSRATPRPTVAASRAASPVRSPPDRPRPAASPRPGPGSGCPACIASARRSRSAASTSLAGHIGLKLYHWCGAAAIATASSSAMPWVTRWRAAGSFGGTDIGSSKAMSKVSSGSSVDADREDAGAGLGGEGRRSCGKRGPGAEEADRDPVAPVAPVDEEPEQLAAPQDAEDPAQVAPRDERHAPFLLALAAEVVEQLGERGVVGDDADRHAEPGDARADGLVAPHVGHDEDQRPARVATGLAIAVPDAVYGLRVEVDEPGDLVGGKRRQPHQLDEIPPVFGVRP